MAEEITYYAIVDDLSTVEQPAGVLRRIKRNGGETDETFGTDLMWARSALMYSAERGDLENKFVPISEEEAERIVSRIRETFGGGAGLGHRAQVLAETVTTRREDAAAGVAHRAGPADV
jgi:hypothetical protein